MDDAREEMRKLIDVIEKGAKSTGVEQAVDDIKLFANTAGKPIVKPVMMSEPMSASSPIVFNATPFVVASPAVGNSKLNRSSALPVNWLASISARTFGSIFSYSVCACSCNVATAGATAVLAVSNDVGCSPPKRTVSVRPVFGLITSYAPKRDEPRSKALAPP